MFSHQWGMTCSLERAESIEPFPIGPGVGGVRLDWFLLTVSVSGAGSRAASGFFPYWQHQRL